MKKVFMAMAIVAAMFAAASCACGNQTEEAPAVETKDTTEVVAADSTQATPCDSTAVCPETK